MCPTMMPIKSVVALFPSRIENENSTHGKYGAVNGNSPRKLIRTCSLRRPQRYTIMNVSDEPKSECSRTAPPATGITHTTHRNKAVQHHAVQPVSILATWTYDHHHSTQQQHVHEVRCPTAEGPLLE